MKTLFIALALLVSAPSFAQQDVENARRALAKSIGLGTKRRKTAKGK